MARFVRPYRAAAMESPYGTVSHGRIQFQKKCSGFLLEAVGLQGEDKKEKEDEEDE